MVVNTPGLFFTPEFSFKFIILAAVLVYPILQSKEAQQQCRAFLFLVIFIKGKASSISQT